MLRYLPLLLIFIAFQTQAVPTHLSKFRVNKNLAAQQANIPIDKFEFEQKIDHFAPTCRYFYQNYWVSPGYSTSSDSPVLLYICGETACSEGDVKFMFPWAKTIGASVVVIEHRYYGDSRPFQEYTAKNLKFLNMTQAMADFAVIVKELKKKMTGPWIIAGGSYSGMIASSFKLTYPDLVTGAWSSSGPLHVVDDYQGYDAKMVEAMGPKCTNSMRQVISYAEAAVQDPASFEHLRRLFGAPNLTNADDFLFGISDVAAAAIQYGMTDYLCNSFQSPNAVEDYATFLAFMKQNFGYQLDSYSFSSILDPAASDARAFFYQQCNELGLFQTANKNPELAARSQRLDINYMRQGCKRAFGEDMMAATEEFNARYFQPILKSKVSEVYYSNGSMDPWASLGIALENGTWTSNKVYAQMIKGAAHCDDLSFDNQSSTPALTTNGAQVQLVLKKWAR